MNRGKGYICPECGKLHVLYSAKYDYWKCPKCGYKGKDFELDSDYYDWEEYCFEYGRDEVGNFEPDTLSYIRRYGIPRNPEFREQFMQQNQKEIELLTVERKCPYCHQNGVINRIYEVDDEILFKCSSCRGSRNYRVQDLIANGINLKNIPQLKEEDE